jgi:hypothetical protein
VQFSRAQKAFPWQGAQLSLEPTAFTGSPIELLGDLGQVDTGFDRSDEGAILRSTSASLAFRASEGGVGVDGP